MAKEFTSKAVVNKRVTISKRAILIRVTSIALISSLSLSLVSCSKDKKEDTKDTNTAVFSISDTALDTEIGQFISGIDSEHKYISADLVLADGDRYDTYEIIDKYTSDNIIYIKVKVQAIDREDYCIYRFEVGESGLIDKYVKYFVEA